MSEALSGSTVSPQAPWLQITKNPITAETPFSEAAELWLGSISGTKDIGFGRLRRVHKTTEHSYRSYIESLKLFFGEQPLGEIRLDHIKRYEAQRIAGQEPFIRYRRPQDARPRTGPNGEVIPPKGKTPCPVSAKKVNQELAVLKRILRSAGVWDAAKNELHQPLDEEESDIERALTPEEQRLWLQTARLYERWHLVYHYSELAFATCMSTNEIRSLRIGDVHLEAGRINIPWAGSKNRYRHRRVEIGQQGDASWHAVEWLLNRAYSLGSKLPNHYLFPFRQKNGGQSFTPAYDVSKPMSSSGIKNLWNEVREATGLKGFRPYDTRHTAITRLAENGESIAVIMEMAGHISPQMTQHYTHISSRLKLHAMRRVQANIAGQPKPPRSERAVPAAMVSPVREVAASTPQVRDTDSKGEQRKPVQSAQLNGSRAAQYFGSSTSSYLLNRFTVG